MGLYRKSALSTSRIGERISALVRTRPALNSNHDAIPHELIKLILREIPSVGVLLLDRHMAPVYTNSAFGTLLGIDALSDSWHQNINTADVQYLLHGMASISFDSSRFKAEFRVAMANSEVRWLKCETQPLTEANSGYDGSLCIFTDITDQKLATDNLTRLSLYDSLTSLPNRSLLLDRLTRALAPGKPNDLALVFVDLDGFKLVNDTLGRQTGNQIIKEVSERLNFCLEPTDLLARHGSDEFTAVIEQNNASKRAAEISELIISAIKRPFYTRKESVFISASVGIAVAKPGISPDRLIQQADVAMYKAKKQKGNAVQYHSHELTARNRAKLLMGNHLHCALERSEFKVFYQPQLDIASNNICGSEALLRWKNPEVGSISPSIFVPMLEELGLINAVGEWVLSEACHNQARWHRDYPNTRTTVSVNVSSLQLHDRHFLDKLKQILQSSGLAPDALVLEITETILLDEFVSQCRLLHEINSLGVKIALDDFGTGYGSFSYLKKHPIDHIKIDRSFVDNLFSCDANKAITTSIIDLSHKLGKTVIAEGVDSQEELDFLMMKGCDIYQGFYTCKAIPSADFARRFFC